MKAIILAGGEGTRLRPLTDNTPKPMLDIAGRPALEHIVALLCRCGFDDIMITLRYKPEAVINHFRIAPNGSVWNTGCGDVTLRYRVETTPRGTAGAVADCLDFVGDEDFLVMSGDCLCDFDLGVLLDYHKRHNAALTLALYECAEPTEFGLVVTDGDDRVRGFTEKPAWERVITDCVNTGVYALSPSALKSVPETDMFDFARDLFPRLLAENADVYAVPLGGYWRDIGTVETLNAAVNDAESGVVALYSAPCDSIRPRTENKSFNITFASRGVVAGTPGEHLPYDAILRLGQACAPYRRVGFGYSGGDLARCVSELLSCGANSYGADAVMTDAPIQSAAAYVARTFALPLTIFVTQRGESVRIAFLDNSGTLINHDEERILVSSSTAPRICAATGSKSVSIGTRDAYIAWLRSTATIPFDPVNATCTGGGEAARILRTALRLKPDVPDLNECADETDGNTGIASFHPGADGTTLLATTETGKTVDFDHLLLLGTFVALKRGARELTLPPYAPVSTLRLCESYGRTALRSNENAEPWTRDGILLGALLASYMSEQNVSLDALTLAAPEFVSLQREVRVRTGRASLMRELTRAVGFEAATELGIELRPGGGIAHVCPERASNTLRIRVEAQDARSAENIASELEQRIRALDAGAGG